LAAEIRERFAEATVDLVPSSGGRFEVTADGAPVFEKSKLHRHAGPGEVVALLEKRRAAG
jgi:predicted Rdx family selenoprotein